MLPPAYLAEYVRQYMIHGYIRDGVCVVAVYLRFFVIVIVRERARRARDGECYACSVTAIWRRGNRSAVAGDGEGNLVGDVERRGVRGWSGGLPCENRKPVVWLVAHLPVPAGIKRPAETLIERAVVPDHPRARVRGVLTVRLTDGLRDRAALVEFHVPPCVAAGRRAAADEPPDIDSAAARCVHPRVQRGGVRDAAGGLPRQTAGRGDGGGGDYAHIHHTHILDRRSIDIAEETGTGISHGHVRDGITTPRQTCL